VTVAAAVAVPACGASAGPSSARTPDTAAASSPRAVSPTDPASAASTLSPSPTPSVLPLAGKIVGIDPGHNGDNHDDPAYIDRQIWNGRESEDCDTTGTETDSGYTEAQFNFNVASFLRADLIKEGAGVVMTRTTNDGVGPCVTTRAQIINDAHANVAVDIHADGGPPSGRGFAILEPVADGPNDAVITSSAQFGDDVRQAFLSGTQMPESTYDGVQGITQRDDLAGLNLTTVPKVLIECGNMRNATDAGLLTSVVFQQEVARAMEAAIIRFLA
jgi:N-acetylmuramoyl-L-alanine amidase